MKTKYFAKTIFYSLFVAIPFLLWILDKGRQLYFNETYLIFNTTGRGAGIIGISMFAGNLLLSGRYHFMDKLFGGLDKLYLFHRQNGITTFVILSLHVLAITGSAAFISWNNFWRFTFDFRDVPVNWGRAAYLGLLTLVIISIFGSGKIKYEWLKKIHQFMGVFFFFGGVHAFLIPSDIALNKPLRYYILGLVAIATASYLWRTVFRQWLLPRKQCEVIAVNKLNENVTEVILKPIKPSAIKFYPGQFIFVKFKQHNFPYEDHPFSITASTEEGTLRISAKNLGDFTAIISQLKPGARAEIQGPYGGFSFLRSSHKEQVWIAGGIGITPFMSMARTMRDKMMSQYTITIIYSVNTENDMVFKTELEKIASEHKNFTFIPWITSQDGYLTVEKVKQLADIHEKAIFLCGPKHMVDTMKSQLKTIGISRSLIHFELFKLL